MITDKKNKDMLLNMDNEFICNIDTGEFGIAFSAEQRSLIIKLIDLKSQCPIESIGYPHLPAKQMGLIYILLYKNNKNADMIRPVDVWKIVHMGLDDEQLYWTCICMRYGVFLADTAESVRSLPADYLENTAVAAAYGKDFSNMLKDGITKEELARYHDSIGAYLDSVEWGSLPENEKALIDGYEDIIDNWEEFL